MTMASPAPFGLSSRRHAFSLVEVSIAIAVIAVAFVSLLALLPAGNTAFRRAIDLSTAAQIANRVISDAQQSDFDTLIDRAGENPSESDAYTFRAPRRAQGVLRYFDDQGREIVPANGMTLSSDERLMVIYQVNMRVRPRAMLPADYSADAGLRSVYQLPRAPRHPMAQVTVQVAHNPSGKAIPFSDASADDESEPLRNLWEPTKDEAGIEIFTYSAVIGRN